MDKKDFRVRAKSQLDALSKEDIQTKSQAISLNLKVLLDDINSKHSIDNGVIGAYAPIQQEVLWFLNFKADEFNYCVPHMLAESRMEFYEVPLEMIKENKLGLELESQYRQQVIKPQILIIPGLGFTIKGERLGRGKGYYDRYLSGFSGIKVGVCFETQVFETIPTDEHDIELDYLVTETEIYIIIKG